MYYVHVCVHSTPRNLTPPLPNLSPEPAVSWMVTLDVHPICRPRENMVGVNMVLA